MTGLRKISLAIKAMNTSGMNLATQAINMVRDAGENCSPFVCHKQPFVCQNRKVILPFIGLIIPSVFSQKKTRGFTLIELIVTLTIAGILIGLAAPNMYGFFGRNRLATQINDLIADINLARNEAIKRNTSTGICTSTTGSSCAAGGNWANGWMVYADEGGGAITVIKVHEALSGANTLAHSVPSDALIYSKSGILSSGSGNLTLCDSKLKKSRILNIGATGRPSLSEGTCL